MNKDERNEIEEARKAVIRWAAERVGPDAEDLAQEAVARVLAARAEGKAIGNVRAYLFGIARHLVMDHFRARKALPLKQDVAAPEQERRETVALMAVLRKAARATQDPQTAIRMATLHYLKGMPLRAVAQKVGRSYDAVKTTLYRLRIEARRIARGGMARKVARKVRKSHGLKARIVRVLVLDGRAFAVPVALFKAADFARLNGLSGRTAQRWLARMVKARAVRAFGGGRGREYLPR